MNEETWDDIIEKYHQDQLSGTKNPISFSRWLSQRYEVPKPLIQKPPYKEDCMPKPLNGDYYDEARWKGW